VLNPSGEARSSRVGRTSGLCCWKNATKHKDTGAASFRGWATPENRQRFTCTVDRET